MRLDHISYVTSHDQLADTVQRLGSRLGTTFVDGGIHPRFGTRNFTTPLKNSQYIEVVCPLDHPAASQTAWGQAVSKKANEGGGWFTWVFSTSDLTPFELKFGRQAADGHRTLPNGTDLKWKQIGVKEIVDAPELPFFIQWLSSDHPSQGAEPQVEIKKIVIADNQKLSNSWFQKEILESLTSIEIEWVPENEETLLQGIMGVELKTVTGNVLLD
jgi:hypothetical protein